MIRAFAAAIALLITTPVLAQEALNAQLIELIRGNWKVTGKDGKIITGCDKAQRFEPDNDGRRIRLTQFGSDYAADYLVLHTDESRILTYMENEKRQTADGDPVLWWAYFEDKDHFRWRRYDWPRGAQTGQWTRCDIDQVPAG